MVREDRVFVGILELDVLLGDVHSLKQKRAVIRPLLARLRRFDVSATEAGDPDRHRRALVGLAVASGDSGHITALLDRCERLVVSDPELELLSARRRLVGPED